VKFKDQTIVSCSLDGTVKTWDMASGRCVATLRGHTDWVNMVDLDERKSVVDNAASCSYDASIKIWDLKRNECRRTLWGHQNIVWGVQLSDNTVTSCSSDGTIRTWDAEAGTCFNILTGHLGAVYCLQYDSLRNVVVTGAMDKTIKFWDLRSAGSSKSGCYQTLSGHADRLCCLQHEASEWLVVSGSRDSTIKIWDTRMICRKEPKRARRGNGEEEEVTRKDDSMKTLRGHEGRVCCLQFDEDKIVSGSDDNTVKVWSLTGDEGHEDCVNTLVSHDCWINSLKFNGNILVSGAADDSIKVWDFLQLKRKERRRGGRPQNNGYGGAGLGGLWSVTTPVYSRCLIC